MKECKKGNKMLPTTAILLILLVSLIVPLSAGNPTTETLVKGNTAFAVELYRELEGMEGNKSRRGPVPDFLTFSDF